MRIKLFVLALALLPMAAFAQSTPVGKWKTVDDKTQKPKSTVEIYETTNGSLAGKVLQVLESDKGPHPVCDLCDGERKNKPIEGMVILWGVKHDGDVWDGGKILDPKNGKMYSVKLSPSADGKTMEVRGFLGFSLLGRSQTWTREP
jgi:uncharacterized protein (DUF2147 family)